MNRVTMIPRDNELLSGGTIPASCKVWLGQKMVLKYESDWEIFIRQAIYLLREKQKDE